MLDTKPEILAPAGDETCFLAALAAGADAVYAGLKHFSARMEADNFSISQLAALANLTRARGARLYVPMNVMLKPGEARAAGNLARRLARDVGPDGLIIQDLALLDIARQAGFEGELHLSTLANLSHPAGLALAARLGASRVVLPRELNLDEIKQMAEACPPGLDLEVFVHGALCHNVSGRCWWSTSLGGKSGLRGRCVQPCRRLYRADAGRAGRGESRRWFSCLDLGLDVLVRPLAAIPQVGAWKIEGRKKGPHYVYYVVAAYRMLRDQGNDAQARKAAVDLLEQALSRPTSHSVFLPQRAFQPVNPEAETGSGLQVGKVAGQGGKLYITPRLELLPGDLLRVGYEDEAGHRTVRVTRRVPKGGRFDLGGGPRRGKDGKPGPGRPAAPLPPGRPVFLVDRREPGLVRAVNELRDELARCAASLPDVEGRAEPPDFAPRAVRPWRPGKHAPRRGEDVSVFRFLPKGRVDGAPGLWLDEKSLADAPRRLSGRLWWWLPPVIWPNEETVWAELAARARAQGGRTFVLGAPWQLGLFPDPAGLTLLAGPMQNAACPETLAALAGLGFHGAFVAPELPGEDLLALPKQSPLPLGVVLRGAWPFGISRILAETLPARTALYSPKNEGLYVRRWGQNHWIYPAWDLDLSAHRAELERAGYVWFAHLVEPRPEAVPDRGRPSEFNWNLKLL
ncbi:MAG: U32 family peptidase [Desulfovibrionaceae bacterium]